MKYMAFALLVLGCIYVPASLGEDKNDLKKLIGTYSITRGEQDEKVLPKEDFAGSVVTITRDKILGTDKSKKEFFACTYTVDASKKPFAIHMKMITPKSDQTSDGVIEVDGDSVKICYSLPGGKAPTTFKAGPKQHFFELKREASK